jgi:cytochrome oxidase Cu insertion factor (SCO1/SenC/PrrC family)
MKTHTILLTLFLAANLSFGQALLQERAADSPSSSFKNSTGVMNVGDFTVVDSDGVEWNLYTLLDGGTTVILDIFQAT